MGVGTFGSRTAALVGSAAWLAARAVRAKAIRIAAALLEAAPADVEPGEEAFAVRGSPGRRVTWARVAAARAGTVPGERPGLEATEHVTVSRSSHASGAHAARVEVDVETGAVRILRYVVAHDCGRVLDPAILPASAVPPVAEIRHHETPTPLNPLGARGAGEGGIMPGYALLAQAIEDALAPPGARVDHVPILPAELWALSRGSPGTAPPT